MRLILCSLLLALSLPISAQYNTLGFGIGTSAFRGESTSPGSLIEEPGIHLYGYYSYWLPSDERFQIVGLLNLDYMRPQINGSGDGGMRYDAHSFVLSPLVGVRFYLDKWLLDYVPEKNQDAFFAGVYFGPAIYYSNYVTPSNIGNDNTYRDIPGISFNTMAQVGYRIFRNEFWSYEAQIGFQHGFNDRWDGNQGNTGVNDWIFQVGVGMSYSFYKFR